LTGGGNVGETASENKPVIDKEKLKIAFKAIFADAKKTA